MGVRPPAENGGDPELIEFGIAALDARLTDANLDFPATRDEIIEAIGDEPVEYDASGHTIELKAALERTDRTEFETERDLLNALHPVFEDLRTSTTPGFLGWLRSLFP